MTGEATMDVDEALGHADEWNRGAYTPLPTADAAVYLAAEVRACRATIARMIVEREDLERELAKWRGHPSRMS